MSSFLAPPSYSLAQAPRPTIEEATPPPPLPMTKICPKTPPLPLDAKFQVVDEVVMGVHSETTIGTIDVGVIGIPIEPDQIVELTPHMPTSCFQ